MIGYADRGRHKRTVRQRSKQFRSLHVPHPFADSKDTTMQVKADDTVQHRAVGDIDGHIGRKIGQNVGHPGKPVFKNEDFLG
ncbi:hypothetical protein D3C73_1342030 [compost metagenome]